MPASSKPVIRHHRESFNGERCREGSATRTDARTQGRSSWADHRRRARARSRRARREAVIYRIRGRTTRAPSRRTSRSVPRPPRPAPPAPRPCPLRDGHRPRLSRPPSAISPRRFPRTPASSRTAPNLCCTTPQPPPQRSPRSTTTSPPSAPGHPATPATGRSPAHPAAPPAHPPSIPPPPTPPTAKIVPTKDPPSRAYSAASSVSTPHPGSRHPAHPCLHRRLFQSEPETRNLHSLRSRPPHPRRLQLRHGRIHSVSLVLPSRTRLTARYRDSRKNGSNSSPILESRSKNKQRTPKPSSISSPSTKTPPKVSEILPEPRRTRCGRNSGNPLLSPPPAVPTVPYNSSSQYVASCRYAA